MVIDRRHFIQGAAFVATAPVMAALVPLSMRAASQASVLGERVPQSATTGTDANSIEFKIDGWDHCDAKVPSANEVLIRINQSWRTGWR